MGVCMGAPWMIRAVGTGWECSIALVGQRGTVRVGREEVAGMGVAEVLEESYLRHLSSICVSVNWILPVLDLVRVNWKCGSHAVMSVIAVKRECVESHLCSN